MKNSFIDLIGITEVAAIAAYDKIGSGDKEASDLKAVQGMEIMLNQLEIDAEIVIGEGDIDEAPQLYLGQKLGLGGPQIDIAVDPIEGTKMVAFNQNNAITVMALSERGSLLKAPDMYMEKMVVSSNLRGQINLEKGIVWNIENAAKHLNKSVNEVKVVVLEKPRHEGIIKDIVSTGAKVTLVPDGDVLMSIDTCLLKKYDIMYCIGGSPEGVINAAIAKSLEGDMQARLLLRDVVKGATEVNIGHGVREQKKCDDLGLKINHIYKLDDLVASDDLIVLATGVTNGSVLKGVEKISDSVYSCESLFIRNNTGTIMKVNSTHDITKKDQEIVKILNS